MTIQEAIDRIDALKPNRFSFEEKVAWLSNVDGQIWMEIMLTHEHPPVPRCRPKPADDDDWGPQPDPAPSPFDEHGHFIGYTNATEPDEELLVKAPYADDIYVYYLACQIDLGNAEIVKYNNDKTLYNNALQAFADYWNRTHVPLQKVRGFRL